MAHPHHAERAHHIAKAHKMIHRAGYARGGSVHDDAKEDGRMIERGVHEHESARHKGEPKTKLHLGDGVEGEKGRHHLAKRARGGSTGKKHGSTKVNVIVAPQGGGGGPPGMGSPIAPRPAMPPPPPAGAPPPGMMPPGGPPRPPMAMPPGGGMGPPGAGMMRKRGGGIPDQAGGGSGLGRIEKAREYGSDRGFKPKKVPMEARG